MDTRPARPSRRWPAAEWWAPLVVDLAAIQRGSAPLGLTVRRVLLTWSVPAVRFTWPDGTATTLRPDPEAGLPALLGTLSATGPAALPPPGHAETHWAPGPEAEPLLKYAWLLDELGTSSDAWYAYVPGPVHLLEIRTDGTATADVTAARPDRGDAVRVRVPLAGRGEPTGLGYAVAERVATADGPSPADSAETIEGLPVAEVPLGTA